MNFKVVLLVVCLFVFNWNQAAAFDLSKFIDAEDGKLDASRYLSENKHSFLPVPIVITEPAVGYGLGMAAIFFHESAAQKELRFENSLKSGKAILPENISVVGGAATDNGTWGTGIGHLGFWKEDTLRYTGFALYASANLNFYSLSGISLPEPIELNIKGPGVLQEIKWRLGESHWLIGPKQTYGKITSSLTNTPNLPVPLPPKLQEYLDQALNQSVTMSAIGGLLEFDSRDSQFNPQSGFYYRAEFNWFNDSIGSDINYTSYQLKALNYWTLPRNFSVGFRFQYDGVTAANGERLPPYVPPTINLRGIPLGRYQGLDVAEIEFQGTYKYKNRWFFSAFTGLGRAADSFSDLKQADNQFTKGVGFRYLIAKRYGFVMGIDVARGPEQNAFYIQSGSTW